MVKQSTQLKELKTQTQKPQFKELEIEVERQISAIRVVRDVDIERLLMELRLVRSCTRVSVRNSSGSQCCRSSKKPYRISQL
ncbi:hypothetical protein S245_003413 [Arachis hypogaea]